MSMVITPPAERIRVSVADYLAMPTDGPRTELIDGEIVEMPSPRDSHNELIADFGRFIRKWTRQHELGKMFFAIDVILDEAEGLVYCPDLSFLATEHLDRNQDGRVFGAADLAVEILSPSDYPRSTNRKVQDYLRHGVAWVWVFRPLADPPNIEEYCLVNGAIRTLSLAGPDDWFEPAAFPGLSFQFRPLLEGFLRKSA